MTDFYSTFGNRIFMTLSFQSTTRSFPLDPCLLALATAWEASLVYIKDCENAIIPLGLTLDVLMCVLMSVGPPRRVIDKISKFYIGAKFYGVSQLFKPSMFDTQGCWARIHCKQYKIFCSYRIEIGAKSDDTLLSWENIAHSKFNLFIIISIH